MVSRLLTAALLLFNLTTASAVSNIVLGAACATCAVAGVVAIAMTEVVTTGNVVLVERFGKYHRSIGPGWHLMLRPVEMVSFRSTIREQLLDVPPQQCYSKDNASMQVDAIVYLRVFDALKARYEVSDLQAALLNLVLTQLREQVGKLTLDESFSSRDRINKALLFDLNQVAHAWGCEITRVEIQDIKPSVAIRDAMELQMSAERKKRAAILQSEGERATLINAAEGKANAALKEAKANKAVIELMAEAAAEKMRIEADGLKNAISNIASSIGTDRKGIDAALSMLMFQQYMDTQAKFANANGTKVLMFPTKDSMPLTYQGMESLLK